MKAWVLIIGIVLLFFGLYKKFDLITFILGLIVAITGILLKNKKKEVQ